MKSEDTWSTSSKEVGVSAFEIEVRVGRDIEKFTGGSKNPRSVVLGSLGVFKRLLT